MMNYQLPTVIDKTIFRAYDIRGIAHQALTEDLVYALGLAYAKLANDVKQTQVVLARDGRASGPKLHQALAAGLQAGGLTVVDVGMVPTPVMYFATYELAIPNGIMLTGSHNPAEYNGLKMVLQGSALSSAVIQELYELVSAGDLAPAIESGAYREHDIQEAYLKRISNDVKLKGQRLSVVIDCGNGVAGNFAPALFRALGCQVHELYCEVDGNFPNHHPDPSVPENLQDLKQAVASLQADIGLAFDGDADRLGVVTDQGDIIWPDRQLILFATDIIKRKPGAEIIYDVKCSWHLAAAISAAGGKPTMWKTGHSFMKQKLKESAAEMAGEMSGHLFFKDRWYGFDDALYAGARLLEILSNDERSCHEVLASLPDSFNTPEIKIPMPDARKFDFVKELVATAQFSNAELTTIDGLRVDFATGWGLIRPSNTTPCLVSRFEADSEVELKAIQGMFREELLRIDADLKIPF